MAYVRYVAKRSLAPAHVLNAVYTLPLILTRFSRSHRPNRRQQRSLSGKTETLFYAFDIEFDVGIAPVAAYVLPLLREFLSSVMDGQTFALSETGIGDSPDEINVIRIDEGDAENRFVQTGAGSHLDRFDTSFRARKV